MVKSNYSRIFAAILLAILFSGAAESATSVSGTVSQDTQWTLSGSPYVVTSNLTVAEGIKLTIDPGVIVKIARYHSVTVNGTLSANGTSGQPIYFTSVLDDTVGGDTNGDGTATSPGRDNWGQINFTSVSSNNLLNYVVIRYGGYYTSGNLVIATSSITVSNCTSEESSKHGIYVSNAAPVISGCTLKNNSQHGIYLTIDSSNAALSNNTVSGNGSYPNAIVFQNGAMTQSSVFKAQNAVYLIGNVTVNEDVTLTVEPGAMVKISDYCSLSVKGTLKAEGTAQSPVYFTSVRDDAAMGDTYGDAVPVRGIWGQINFFPTSKNSVLKNAVIRYGGYYTSANIYTESSSLTIDSSTIEESSQHGVHISNASPAITGNQIKNSSKNGVYLTNDSKATVTGNTITGNGWHAVAMEGKAVNSLIQTNTVIGKSNGIVLSDGTITEALTFSQQGASYLMNKVTIAEGASVTVDAGVVVKINRYTSVTINGTLTANGTAAQPVYFTSILDDSVGGDTNGDAGASSPARDNWGQMYFTSVSKNNLLNNVVIRYGGYYTSANVVVETSSFTLTNSIVEEGSHHGVYITKASPVLTGSTFRNNSQYGIYLTIDSASTSLTNNTLSGNGSNQGGVGIAEGTITKSLTFSPQNAAYVMGNVTIADGVTLTVLPGAIVKIPRYNSITVHGTIIADGTADNPIYFTSVLDDEVGGDTNGDGDASLPARDNWGYIHFSSASRNNVLNHVTVRYGGYYKPSTVLIETSSLSMTDCTVEEGSHHGIQITNASPSVADCTIRNNSRRGVFLTGASYASITGSRFTGNGWDAVFTEIGSVQSFFKDNTVSNNGSNSITIGGGRLAASATLRNPPEIVYVIAGSISIPEGVSLKIEPGVVVKFARYISLTVDGTMTAAGTSSAPVYFTSLMDDTILGDTNNDGENSKPARDNWGYIRFTPLSRNNQLNYITVRYGGYYTPSNVSIETSSLTMTNSVIEEGSHHGVQVSGAAPTITGSAMRNNSQHGLYLTIDSAHADLADNTVSGNGSYPNGIVYASGTITRSLTFRPQNAVFVFGNVTIDQGAVLTAEPGVIVKIPRYSSLTFNGTLNASGTSVQPIYFTSIVDDAVGGDTNGDGTATTPARDNWGQMRFTSLSQNNALNNVVIRYGGYYTSANLTIETSSFSIANSVIEEGSHNGVYIVGASPLIMGCSIRNNSGHGIETDTAEPLIMSNTISGNGGKGVHNRTAALAVNAKFNYWGDPTGPKDASDDTGSGGLYNPDGLGDAVSDYISYHPWLDYSPHQLAERTEPKVLTADAAYQGTLSSRQIADFIFHPEQGRSVLVEVAPQPAVKSAILDGRLGDLVSYPSLGDYSVRNVTVQGKYELLIPSAEGRAYYFSLFGQDVADPSGQYTITARYADKHLSDTSPKAAGNAGNCTIGMTGLGFTGGMRAELSLGTTVLTSSEIHLASSSELSAWFNLSEAALGKYSVSLIWPDNSRKTLTGGLNVVHGAGARLEAVLVPPTAVRPGRVYTVWLEYKNAGDADMFSPLLTVKANCPIATDKNRIASSQEVQVLGVGKSAVPGILRIGESGRIPIFFNATTPGARITFNLYVTDDNFDPVDWYAQKAFMTPPDLPSAEWEAMWSRLTARLGNTWAQYLNVLRRNALTLKQRGTETYDVKRLIRLEARLAAGLPAAAVSGVLKDEATHLPIQGVPVKAANDDSSVVVQTDTSYPDGHFTLEDLPNGVFGLYAEGYHLSTPASVTISGDKDENGLVLYARKILPQGDDQETEPKIPDNNPSVASDGLNRLFTVWERGGDIWWAVNDGAGWNKYGKIPGAVGNNPVLAYHALLKNAAPGLFCAWETGDSVKTIQWSVGTPAQDGTVAWSAPQSMTSDNYDDFGIEAAVTKDGEPLILWLQKDSGIPDDSDIYYMLLNMADYSLRGLEADDPELIDLITARAVEKCTEIKWPPGDFEGLTLPNWMPIIGGKSGVFFFGKICGSEGCTTTQSGKVGAEVKIGDRFVSSDGSVQAKWTTDKKKCIYVFNEGSLSANIDGKIEIPTTPVPIVIVGVPLIGVLPVGTGQIVGTISVNANAGLNWKSNFPGMPSHGNIDITFGGDLKGKVLLASGFAGGDVTGGVRGTMEFKTPPLSAGFKEYCVTLSGTGSIGWGFVNRSWTKKWGSCADARSLLRNISEKDLLLQSNCQTVEGIIVCEEVQLLKEIFKGTANVYEGNPAFAPDLVNDGSMSVAVSGTGEILMVWSKDENPDIRLGAKVYSSVYQNGEWQTPAGITSKADFNKDAAVVFDYIGIPMAVWSQAPSDNLNYADSFVEDILAASERADIWFSRRIGGVWTDPATIAELPGRDEMASVAAGPDGEITAVWQNANGNGMTLYASIFNGTSWSEPAAIFTSSFASAPKVVYVSGKPTVVWAADFTLSREVSADWRILSSAWDGSAWSAPAPIRIETSARTVRSVAPRTLRSAAPPAECCDKKDDDPNPPDPPKKPAGGADTPKIVPIDPNEKVAATGVGDLNYVTVEERLTYKVYFENKAEAQAPAQEVFVMDYLDADLDWTTLRMEEVSFGDIIVANTSDHPMLNAKVNISDYRDLAQLWQAEIRSVFESQNGCLNVSLHTLDPETGDLPEDAFAGLLPPEDGTGRGQGYFTFTVNPLSDRTTGTLIKNSATIIFDTEAPIVTNEVVNMITDQAPDAKTILPATASGAQNVAVDAMLGWSSADFASSYDVYVWKGDQPEPSAPTASNLKSTFYDPERHLAYETVYNWQVKAANVKGSSESGIWSFTTSLYPYLRDAIVVLEALAGVDLGDISYVADIDGDAKRGLPEVIYFLQKAAELR